MASQSVLVNLATAPTTHAVITDEVDVTAASPLVVLRQLTAPVGTVVTGGGYRLTFFLGGVQIDEKTTLGTGFTLNAVRNGPTLDPTTSLATGWEVELHGQPFTNVDTSTQFDTIKLTTYTCVSLTWTSGALV